MNDSELYHIVAGMVLYFPAGASKETLRELEQTRQQIIKSGKKHPALDFLLAWSTEVLGLENDQST